MIQFLKQLKEMVLALLDESDLVLSDDIVEMIVDKARILTPFIFDDCSSPVCDLDDCNFLVCFGQSRMQMENRMVKLTRKSGRNT